MAQFVNIYDVELTNRSNDPLPLRAMVGEGDAKGLLVGARVTNNGASVTLGGSCVGKVVRSDGNTVSLTGTIDGNLAYVVLDQQCCAIEGPIQIAVCWVSSSNVTTLVVAYGTVVSTQTGNAIQPSTPIPDLTQLLAEIDAMETATAAAVAAASGALHNFAGAFDATQTYTAGQYVTYTDGNFYRLTADHAANVTWANTSKVQVTTGGELINEATVRAFNDSIIWADIAPDFNAGTAYSAGQYVINPSDGFLYRLTAAHAANVTWANTSKVLVTAGGELADLKSALNTETTLRVFNEGITRADIAPEFNAATVYSAGQYVINPSDGLLYKLTANHAANVTWDNTSKIAVTAGGELTGLKRSVSELVSLDLTWTDGVYQTTSGTTAEHEQYSVSNYIPIWQYSSLVVIADILDHAAICIFDKDQAVIGAYRNSGTTRPYVLSINLENFSVNAQKAYYIRLCSLTSSKNDAFISPLVSMSDTIKVYPHEVYANLNPLFKNLNNLPSNSVVSYYFGWTEEITAAMSNFPTTPFSGQVITINNLKGWDSAAWGVQFAINYNSTTRELYYRTRYTSWSRWQKIVKDTDIIYIYDNLTYAETPVALRDCDTIPVNTVAGYHFGWTEEITPTMAHFPVTPFYGLIMTINTVKSAITFGTQIAIEETLNSHRMWVRTRYTSWSGWREIAFTSDIPASTNDYQKHLYAAFDVVGVIGDSLASGECFTPGGEGADMYEYSWLQFMCREADITGYNFSRGGATCASWIDDATRGYGMASQSDKLCKAYFIGLGQNDANHSYPIGTIADIDDSDYHNNADTYYGNYGGIIQRMKELVPDAKFFLFTDPLGASSTTREAYNVAVRAICEHFTNCYLIDLSADYSDIYLSPSGFIQQNNTSNHYSAAAYKYMANIIGDIVDSIIINNAADFKYIQFIEN
ncbi:MAG: SGNH/GDSL hydrolase family protein [Oscillospiraceae bacterium]|nr:SGNH/GDSL hydrolase family protein [Oscillospiraceae bacterium]